MLILPKCLLFLCIVSYSLSSNTLRQGEKLVDSVVDALTAVKLDDAHILTALNELGPKAAKLFKTLVPLGSLALQTFATKPRSDEHKILKELKNRTQPVWNDNDDIIVVSAGALGLHELLKQYKEKVTDQIRKLNEYSDKYLDPEANKEASFIKEFKDLCESGKSSPISILQFLSDHLELSCENPLTPSDAQTISAQRLDLLKILYRFQVRMNGPSDLGILLPEYNLISEPIKDILLKEPLNPFPNEYENYQNAARHLFDELRLKETMQNADNKNSECLLKQMVTMVNFRYPAVQYFGYQLESQLILLSKVAYMCGSILYKDDAEGLETYEERITSHVARIATHVSQYLNNSLISAWPYTHNGILQEMIMTYVPKREEAEIRDLKTAANVACTQLKHIGLPINVYETLIVQVEENNYESFFEGTGTNCFINKQHKGFETIICRIPCNIRSWKEKYQVEGRMYDQTFVAEKLNTTIQSEMSNLYNADDLQIAVGSLKEKSEKTFYQSEMSRLNATTNFQVIANSLKTKIGDDILNEFSGWAIIRESNHTKCTDIKLWSSPYNSVALESITALSYTNKGSFTQNCEEFRFFFFM